MKAADIVYEYFKQVFEDTTIIIKLNPHDYSGTEMIIHPDGKLEITHLNFDENIYEDLKIDHFKKTSPLEYNLYLNKLV
jgi:hypothetical protein